MNVTCESCEAEFFVSTQEEVKYCVVCGYELDVVVEDDWMDEYEEELGDD